MVANHIKILEQIDLDALKQDLRAVAESAVDENGKPLPLSENQKEAVTELIDKAHQQLIDSVGQETNPDGPLPRLTLTPRDESQSAMKAMAPQGEKMMAYRLIENIPIKAAEVDGGRFGAEGPLMFHGQFPRQAREALAEFLPTTERMLLTRSSAVVGFSKYNPEDQKNIAQAFLSIGEADQTGLIRTFSSPNSTNDMFPHLEALAEAGLRIMPAVAYAVSKSTDAFSAENMSDFVARASDKALALTASLPRAGHVEVKDFADRMPPTAKIRDNGTYRESKNAVTADELMPAIKSKIAPGVELYVHTHDTVGYGVEKAVTALQSGADAVSVSAAPARELAQPNVLTVLDRMQDEGLGQATDYERGVLEIIDVFNQEFVQVKNAAFIAPKPSDIAKQGAIDAGAPGGGYGAVAAYFDEMIFEKTDGLDTAKAVLLKAGVEVATPNNEQAIKEQARTQLDTTYFETLENYRKKTGEYGLVTPYYAYANELTVANLEKALSSDTLTFEDIQRTEHIDIIPSVSNMLTGRADASPAPVDAELREKAINALVDSAQSNIGVELNDTQRAALREMGEALNERMQLADDVLKAHDWVKDIQKNLDDIDNGRFDYGDADIDKDAFRAQRAARLEIAEQALQTAVENYDVGDTQQAIAAAMEEYNVHLRIHTQNTDAAKTFDGEYKSSNPYPLGEETQTQLKQLAADIGIGSTEKMLELLSASMVVTINPAELEPERWKDAQAVMEYMRDVEKIVFRNDNNPDHPQVSEQEAVALLTLGKVSLGAELQDGKRDVNRGVTKFDVYNVIKSREQANDIINEMSELLQTRGIEQSAIDGVLNQELREYATNQKLSIRFGKGREEVLDNIKDIVSNALKRDYDIDVAPETLLRKKVTAKDMRKIREENERTAATMEALRDGQEPPSWTQRREDERAEQAATSSNPSK